MIRWALSPATGRSEGEEGLDAAIEELLKGESTEGDDDQSS
jgi:hypothetical protein